jgi:putative DNA methylase
MKRAIEQSFPIVEINRLAVPERNAFKPIYQMHKWFARRASCVFRAILLGAMKPAGTDLMAEFYKDHTHDPDTKGVRILDPFMGGGTTVVEALRIGCHVTGIDLNPVAWFIVKSEVEAVDIDKLKDAFKRLEERKTISGKSVKEELLSHYKTECPCCGAGREEADIVYTFWVKSAICTSPTCRKEVPLFSNYIIAMKSPSVRFLPDYECSACKKVFDLDIDRASLIAENSLMITNPRDASGDKRSNKRWAVYDHIAFNVTCPWCSHTTKPLNLDRVKKEKKKVPLTVLLCPHCSGVWQYRGTLLEEVTCPVCKKGYEPLKGNVSEKGSFVCPSCGNKDKIINSIRKLPQEQLLTTKPYAIEGYCRECAGDMRVERKNVLGETTINRQEVSHGCNLSHNNGRFFTKVIPADLKRYQEAEQKWNEQKEILFYPKSKIPEGEKTKNDLIGHHYIYWYQIFNPRQLLSLATLVEAITQEKNIVFQEMLLSAFFQVLRNQCMLCFYNPARDELEPAMSGHDFRDPNTVCENSAWGTEYGRGTFASVIEKIVKGKSFNLEPYVNTYCGLTKDGHSKTEKFNIDEKIDGTSENCFLLSGDSKQINQSLNGKLFDLVITDPPYADNVNYSELSDFFYVWLRQVLFKRYKCFAPEYTPKVNEIIQNKTRGNDLLKFQEGLEKVFLESGKVLKDDGLLIFTFHHEANEAWVSVLESLFNAGFYLEAVYPYESDARKGGALGAQKIAYDTIHVCKKKNDKTFNKEHSWAGIRQEIRKKAREEIGRIESGRYGKEKLAAPDVNMVLIGKCLELYSKHYGNIVDYKGEVVSLNDALTAIRIMVEQIVSTQQPLPSELEYVDPVSYIYLTCLCDRKEIQSDEVHKATRGIMEPEALIKAGVIRKGRAKRGRTYEVKLPGERFKDIQKPFANKFKSRGERWLFPEMEEAKFDTIPLVDVLHYLMGLAEKAENLIPWLKEFQAIMPQIRVSLNYLRERNPTFQEPINKILNLIEA